MREEANGDANAEFGLGIAEWRDQSRSAKEIYIRQVIERGLADSKAGKTENVRAVRERYGLTE